MKSSLLIAVVSTGLVGVVVASDLREAPTDKGAENSPAGVPAVMSSEDDTEVEFASRGDPDLKGRWLKQVITVAESSAGPVGTIEIRTSTLQLVDIAQEGRQVEMEVQSCWAEMVADSSMISTEFTERLVQSLPERSRSGRLYRRDGAWFLGIERDWELLGVTMESPGEETLPSDADDPRVIDQEGDGNPGFTLRVRGMIDGEVYVARRGWDKFMGRINGDEAIRGRVQWESEEKVLDASRRMLRSDPDSTPDTEASRFRMQRVDDEMNCEVVEQRKEALFED